MKTLFRFFWLGLAVWLTAEGRSFQAQAAPVTVPPALKKAVKSIDVSVTPAAAARGQTVSWKLTLEMAPGWHTYPTHQSAAGSQDFVNQFEFPNYKDVVFVGRLQEPPSQTHIEGGIVFQSIEGKGTWERPLVVRENAEPGAKEILVPSVLLACDANHCLPPQKVPLQVPLQVKNEQVAVAAQYANEVRQPAGQPTASPGGTPAQPAASTAQQAPAAEDQAPQTASAYQASLVPILQNLVHQQIPSTGLWAFLLAGVFWGAVTLVTPCVFPMIPITVSYFLHHSEKEHHRPLTMALVYCSTIVVVLTIAAVGLLSFFQWLSRNSLMNFALGILFLGFALSLFGMYDLELPSGLARFTSAREGKGGLAGTVFMALTFTIVSFACVAPFLGGFGGAATSSNLTLVDRVLGGLVFSATFASPFFVLALFPSLLKKVPRSGSWLNSVKVVMGFLELAAALNFFRAGELVFTDGQPVFFTFDLVLGACIALCFLCGLYLLGFYRLPYDTPNEHLGVPRLIFSLLFLSMGFYLLPGLFRSNDQGDKQRPGGAVYAWFESFLLPDGQKESLVWNTNLSNALDKARAERKATGKRQFVFVDFTGVTCKNCKYNEKNIFSRPEVKNLFESYQRVRLYTDRVPLEYYPSGDRASQDSNLPREDAATNLWFEQEAFGTDQLPLYVILEPLPDGKINTSVYGESKINDENGFVEFLKKPLEESRSTSMAFAGEKH